MWLHDDNFSLKFSHNFSLISERDIIFMKSFSAFPTERDEWKIWTDWENYFASLEKKKKKRSNDKKLREYKNEKINS